jgi:hypothetical protein
LTGRTSGRRKPQSPNGAGAAQATMGSAEARRVAPAARLVTRTRRQGRSRSGSRRGTPPATFGKPCTAGYAVKITHSPALAVCVPTGLKPCRADERAGVAVRGHLAAGRDVHHGTRGGYGPSSRRRRWFSSPWLARTRSMGIQSPVGRPLRPRIFDPYPGLRSPIFRKNGPMAPSVSRAFHLLSLARGVRDHIASPDPLDALVHPPGPSRTRGWTVSCGDELRREQTNFVLDPSFQVVPNLRSI